MTSDAGLVLVRELDERLGLAKFIAEHLSDSRHGLNTQFGVADLLRSQSTVGWLAMRPSTMRKDSPQIRRFG